MYLDLATKNQRIIWRAHAERNFLFLSLIWQCSCSGGGIEKACPLTETVVNFFFTFESLDRFSTSDSATPTLDVGLFFSFCIYLILYSLLLSHMNSFFILLSLEFFWKAVQSCQMRSVHVSVPYYPISVGTQLSGRSHTVITENAEHRIWFEVKFLTLCNVRYTIHQKFTSNTHLHAIIRPHFYFRH